MRDSSSAIELFDDVSFIMYHKSPSSGRTRFLRQESGALCALTPLPRLSEVMEKQSVKVVPHSRLLTEKAAKWFGITEDEVEIDSDFHERVDIAGGMVNVYLVRFKNIDPPFAAAERIGASFIAITEAINVLPAELELLRRAYSVIMGD